MATHWFSARYSYVFVLLLVASEFETARPTPQNQSVEYHWVFQCSAEVVYTHMSMIVLLPDDVLGVAFQASGYGEGCNDQSIFFKLSYDAGVTWTPHSVIVPSSGFAVWGPVLYFDYASNELWLFYSESTPFQNRTTTGCGGFGQSYPGGSIKYIVSQDLGTTWSAAVTILSFADRGQVSKVTANHMIVTSEGSWLLPFWQEPHTIYDTGLSCSGVLRSTDLGVSWTPYAYITNNASWLIENTLAQLPSGEILQLFRTQLGFIYQSVSLDDGVTWSNATATSLLNPDSKVCLCTRNDTGAAILGYNPSSTARNPLALAITSDGLEWDEFVILDESTTLSLAYPTPIQYGSQIYTTYSADTSTGIKLAITAIPPPTTNDE